MARAIGTIAQDETQPGPRRTGSRAVGRVMAPLPSPEMTGRGLVPTVNRFGQVENMPIMTGQQISESQPATIGQRALGLGEAGLQMGTGALADVAAGVGGLAKTITSGPEAGAETVKGIQQALTYEPRSKGAKAGYEAVGQVFGPVVKPVAQGLQKAADVTAEAAGPAAGATVATLPFAIAEIMGLKGSKAFKRGLIKKAVSEVGTEQLVDEAGRILPKVEKAMADAGMGIDDMKEILPGSVEAQAGEVGKTVASRVGRTGRLEKLAEAAQPNPEIVKAATEFGLLDDMLTSHTTKDFTHAAVVQGLASIPGSRLAARQDRLLRRVAQKADELIREFGGTTEKTELSDTFRTRAKQTIDDLANAAETEYGKIREEITKQAAEKGASSPPVSADNILKYIDDKAAELGGEEWLTPLEKKLKKGLAPDQNPTYARLDDIRKQIGEALNKGTGSPVFKNAPTARLKKLYGELAKDQLAAAEEMGFGDLYKSANQLVATRKAIEDQMVQTLGKDITGNITAKAKKAINDLSMGDTKSWDNLAENIPKELGKDQRREIFATALNDAFAGRSRKNTITPAAFDDFMKNLNRNPAAAKRLATEIGSENYDRLKKFHTVVGGIRRGLDQSIHTGRVMAVPGIVDEIQTLAQRLYGAAEGAGKRTPIIKNIFVSGIEMGPKIKRSVQADELLDSPQFRNMAFQKAAGNLDTPEKLARANRLLEANKAFKKWATTLEPGEASALAKVGAIDYLMGKGAQTIDEEQKETEQ